MTLNRQVKKYFSCKSVSRAINEHLLNNYPDLYCKDIYIYKEGEGSGCGVPPRRQSVGDFGWRTAGGKEASETCDFFSERRWYT